MTSNDEKIFTELEKQISYAGKDGGFTSGCRCKVCIEARDPEEPDADCFGSAIDGHKKLFTLLQHLTMLDADAPIILGELRIPMLFFKRLKTIEKTKNLNRSSIKKPSVSNYYSFLSFESN